MGRETLATLFHPFYAGLIETPAKAARGLFLGAEPGFRLPEGFDAALHLVQGFRPAFRGLELAGHAVSPTVPGEVFDFALVLCGRHRGQNEVRIAEALEHVRVDGTVLVAGGKDDGIQSLRKRIARLAGIGGHAPKYHGEAFWLMKRPDAPETIAALHGDNGPVLIDGRFQAAPGMFSFDRIDAGSRLLAQYLPHDLTGAVADFCAGWGYLAAEALARGRPVKSLDLYEADFDSLQAARRNIPPADVPVGFFWQDLMAEPVVRRYDAILMNPPFHAGRAADPGIGHSLIRAAASALKPGGRLFMVANRQLPYERVLMEAFASVREVANDGGFKVFAARR